MKKVVHLLLCGLGLLQCLAACNKEPEPQPAEKVYDFSGRRYERYSHLTYGKRTFYAIDFTSATNLQTYHGTDSIGSDSTWHRYGVVEPSLVFAYHIRTDIYYQPDTARLILWTYLGEEPFDIEEFEGNLSSRVYLIDTTETYIRKYNEPAGKTYVRVQ